MSRCGCVCVREGVRERERACVPATCACVRSCMHLQGVCSACRTCSSGPMDVLKLPRRYSCRKLVTHSCVCARKRAGVSAIPHACSQQTVTSHHRCQVTSSAKQLVLFVLCHVHQNLERMRLRNMRERETLLDGLTAFSIMVSTPSAPILLNKHTRKHTDRSQSFQTDKAYVARNCTSMHQEASEIEAKERRGKRGRGGEAVIIEGRAGWIKRQRVRVMRERQGVGEAKAEHLLLFKCRLARAPRREGSERAKTNAMVPSSPTELKSRLRVVSSGHLCQSAFARYFITLLALLCVYVCLLERKCMGYCVAY